MPPELNPDDFIEDNPDDFVEEEVEEPKGALAQAWEFLTKPRIDTGERMRDIAAGMRENTPKFELPIIGEVPNIPAAMLEGASHLVPDSLLGLGAEVGLGGIGGVAVNRALKNRRAVSQASKVLKPLTERKLHLLKDGSAVDKETGEILDKAGNKIGQHPYFGTSPTGTLKVDNTKHAHLAPPVDAVSPSKFYETFNLSRGLKASWDFSAPLRQGIPLASRKEYWKAWVPMFKAYGSENAYRMVQDDIAKMPSHLLAKKSGVHFTDLTDLSNREEAIMSTWAEVVPGVRRSNRAYTAFLNKLRADTFERLVKDSGADKNPALAEALAKFVNTATGRGSLYKSKLRKVTDPVTGRVTEKRLIDLEQSAMLLNSTLFSPRLMASRLQMLNPNLYLFGPKPVRKEALRSLFTMASIGSTLAGLAGMAGADVETNPTSSDFGKIKIGETRIDPYAGFQQYIVAAARLGQWGLGKADITSGKGKALSGKSYPLNAFNVVSNFAWNKAHPTLSFAKALLSGKDFKGDPITVPGAIADTYIPMIMEDVYELHQENPELLPLAIPAAFGMGVQTHEK